MVEEIKLKIDLIFCLPEELRWWNAMRKPEVAYGGHLFEERLNVNLHKSIMSTVSCKLEHTR